MGAQTVKEVPNATAQALLGTPGAKKLGPHTFGIPSRGVTVTVAPSSKPGFVKLLIVKGCTC